MPAPVSVIIPTLNAELDLREALPFVMEGVGAGIVREVIVSDGGSSDRTADLAEAAGADVVSGPAGRGGQLARGAKAARGDWFLFLHADTHLPSGWSDLAAGAVAGPEMAHVFRLSFRAKGLAPRLVAGWANVRTRAFHLPFGDQGLLMSRGLYEAVGGFSDIPLMEDVDIARKLGRRISVFPNMVTTSANRYLTDGWLRRGAHNLRLQARFLMGASPEKLCRDYASESVNYDR